MLHARPSSGSGWKGFSLVEVLVVLTMIGVLAGLGIPAVVQSFERLQLESGARVCVSALRRARNEAIRRGVPVVVTVDPVRGALETFADVDDGDGEPISDLLFNPCTSCVPARPARATDYRLPTVTLPGQVSFWGADDAEPNGEAIIDALTPSPEGGGALPLAVFDPDGSARDIGALRVGSGPFPRTVAAWEDTERNFLEVRIVVASTARIEVRKWQPDVPATAAYVPLVHGPEGSNWTWF